MAEPTSEDMMALYSSPALLDVRPFKRGWLKEPRRSYLEERLPIFREERRKGRSFGREYVDGVFNAFCQVYPWWLAMDAAPDPATVYNEQSLPSGLLGKKAEYISRLATGVHNFFETKWNKAEPVTKMSKSQIAKNPVAALLAKVGDVKIQRQRGRTADQMFSSERFPSLRDDFNQEFAETGKNGKRDRLDEAASKVRKAYRELPDDEKKYWEQRAKEDALAVARAKADTACLPARLGPEATQEVLDGLANTMQPLMEGLSALLGGNISFFWAGPEPRKGGQVNVVSLHVGSDKSAIPQTFATAGGERGKRRRKMAEACMGEFAMECFTYAEQEARGSPGVAMTSSIPMFMRQQHPWNVAGNEFMVESAPSANLPLLSSNALSPPAAGQNTKKRDRKTVDKPRKQARRQGGKTRPRSRVDEDSSASDSAESDEDDDDENSGQVPPLPPPTRSQTKQATALASPRSPLQDVTNIQNPVDNTAIDPALLDPVGLAQLVIPTCGPLDSDHPFGDRAPPSSPFNPPSSPALRAPLLPPAKKASGKKDPGKPPKTFAHAEAYIRAFEIVDPGWKLVVDTYLAMEEGGKWSGKPLPSRSRPAYVHLWLQNARRIDPELPSAVREVANGFWRWWAEMQPEWRGVSVEDCPLREQHRGPIPDNDGWGSLQTRGLNGHFTTLALLGWWGHACGDDVLALAEWSAALDDVHWVLEGISVD